MEFSKKLLISAGTVGAGVLLFGGSTFEIVTPGYRGVVTRFGRVLPQPMEEGLNFKMPFDSVQEWNVQVQKIETSTNAGSSDLQTVHTDVSVNYRLNPESTPQIRLKIGNDYENVIIKPALQECIKAVIAKYQAAALLEQRAQVRDAMEQALQAKLNLLLADAFVISGLNIENFAFEESFNKAIEAKQVAEQEAQRVRNEVEREKAEADKEIEKARGKAESLKKQAEAEAASITMQAEARAKAIEIESAALKNNPQILKLRTIERWNGVMPRVLGENTGNFLFSLELDDKTVETPPK